MTNVGCTIREWWGERAVTCHTDRLVIGCPLLTSRLANAIISDEALHCELQMDTFICT
jgi:hypothetical protein